MSATSGFRALETTEEPDHELDDLRAMVNSAGWRRFCEMVEGEWSDTAILSRLRASVPVLPDESRVAETTAQTLVAAKAIDRVMRWPVDRINSLIGKATRKPGTRAPFVRT